MRMRLVTASSLALLNLVLTRLVRPSRRQLERSTAIGLAAAAADFAFEKLMKRVGVWEYDLPFTAGGLPLDLSVDFFFWVRAYCLLYSRLENGDNERFRKAVCVAAVSLGLGTWAHAKNKRAAQKGLIRFTEKFDRETPWFLPANYLIISLTVLVVTAAYELSRRLHPEVTADRR
jgi:hypothetical protein